MAINLIKKLFFYGFILFFIFAGFNHFIDPEFYIPLIPDYFPFKEFINYASGIVEIILGIGLFSNRWQRIAGLGIVVLMILFIPSHIWFIQIGSCIEEGLCVDPWIGWVRLVVIHPLLIVWAWWASKYQRIG